MLKIMLTPECKMNVPFCTFHRNLNKPFLLLCFYAVSQTCRKGSIQLRAAVSCNWSNLCYCGVRKAVAQSALPVSVDVTGSVSYINKRASDSHGNLSNLPLDWHSHRTVYAKVIFLPFHCTLMQVKKCTPLRPRAWAEIKAIYICRNGNGKS